MIDKAKIETVVCDLLQGTDKFLVEVDVSATNIIDIYIDGDQGISIGECASLSRQIESEFDREQEDYELRVSSPGLDKPFKLYRQYKKYVGRPIRVELKDGQRWKGILIHLDEDGIELERVIEKKKKETVKEIIPFDLLKMAKPEIVFK
jgi:ribosome maturation factor RimP